MALERLQKVLARAGVASRRKAEEMIQKGLVTVDGRRVTELGVKIDPKAQQVRVNGKLLAPENHYYVLFHKPRGVMCTLRDPEGRPTVVDYLREVPARVLPVGRLDFHTSGVLLLSNDGEFAQALTHPKHHAKKTYVAKVRGIVDDAQLVKWRQPVIVDGQATHPAEVKRLRVDGDKTWLEIKLAEGKNRQIHRIGEVTGNTVLRLARISFAGLDHEGLRPGQWRYLEREELTQLKKEFGVPLRVRSAPQRPESSKQRGGALGLRRRKSSAEGQVARSNGGGRERTANGAHSEGRANDAQSSHRGATRRGTRAEAAPQSASDGAGERGRRSSKQTRRVGPKKKRVAPKKT